MFTTHKLGHKTFIVYMIIHRLVSIGHLVAFTNGGLD